MTDKEKIKAEIERLIAALGEQRDVLLEELIYFIDSLPEEPHQELYNKLSKMATDALTKETKESWNERLDKKDFRERYKRIAQSESFKKAHEGISIGDAVPVEGEEPVINSDWLTELQEKLDNATPEQLEELWNKYNGVDEKEPVSEELEEAAEEELDNQNPNWVVDASGSDGEYTENAYNEFQMKNMFKAGAKWQHKQLEKNRLKHCDSITNEQAELEQGFIDQHLDKYQRMPTFLDAVEYGMRLQKEQMMKDAVDGWVFRDIKEGKLRISDNKECWNGIRIPEKSIEKSYLFCTTDDAIKVKLVIVKED